MIALNHTSYGCEILENGKEVAVYYIDTDNIRSWGGRLTKAQRDEMRHAIDQAIPAPIREAQRRAIETKSVAREAKYALNSAWQDFKRKAWTAHLQTQVTP